MASSSSQIDLRRPRGEKPLEAVLARVAGARDDERQPVALDHPDAEPLRQRRARPEERRENLRAARPLHGQRGETVAAVAQFDAGLALASGAGRWRCSQAKSSSILEALTTSRNSPGAYS